MFLAVDDETRNLEAVARTLRPLGRVETARSGEEAWARFQQGAFDIVISDQRMPGMTGVELLSRVREQDPRVGRVLVTAYADMEATVDAINCGRVHRYLKKPWQPDQLHDCVKALVDQIELEQRDQALAEELAARNCALEHALSSARAEHRRTRDAERSQQMLRRLSGLEGDFQQALAVIIASTDEIRRSGIGLPDVRLRELAGNAFEEAQRLIRLHMTLRAEGRGVSLSLRDSDLDGLVEETLALLEQHASGRGVRIQRELAARLSLTLDPARFGCALEHVLRNAIEASPPGGTIRVESRRDSGEAVVSVSDAGPGVPPDLRDRLFEPFVSGGKPGANGLGLSVVRKVLEEHGGHVEFEDRKGGGTVFRLRLPLDVTAPVDHVGSLQ